MKQPKKRPDLSIVIPAYREEFRIGTSLDELAFFLKNNKTFKQMVVEVIVVVRDSGDATASIVTAKSTNFSDLKVLSPGSKRGKGSDVQYGMLRARGSAIIFMDADLATPLRHLESFYKAYKKGFDIVVGSRDLTKHHPSVIRRFVSSSGNLMFKVASGIWIEDSQCGFKLFSDKAAKLCFSRLKIKGWGFDMEILAIAKVNGLDIKSYRINDWVSVPGGTFGNRAIYNYLLSLGDLIKVTARRLKGTYR